MPLAITEFSFSEDKLLLSAYWANNYESTTEDGINDALCYLYAKAREKAPGKFPKPERYNLYSKALLLRLDTLINSPLYAPLVSLISRELTLQEERDAILKDPESILLKDRSLLAFPPQTDTQEKLIFQRETSNYGKEKLIVQFPLHVPPEELKAGSPVLSHISDSLLYTNLKGQKFISFVTRRCALTRQSNLMSRLYAQKTRDLPPAIYGESQGCFATIEEDAAIELVDRSFPHMASCETHRSHPHLCPDGFARFLLFCRHPTVISEQRLISSAISLAETYATEITNEFNMLIDIRREERLNCLKSWKVYAEKRLCDEVTASFIEAVKEVQLKYEELLKNGAKQIDSVYVDHQVDALQYYDALETEYRDHLQAFFALTQETAGTSRRLADLKMLEEMIFKPIAQLPQLLIMAISLESDTFIDAVTVLIARHIVSPEIYTSPALTSCKLVSEDIYREILRRVSTKDLGLLFMHIRAYGCILMKDCANKELINLGFSAAIRQSRAPFTGDEESTEQSGLDGDKYNLVLQDKQGVTLQINLLTGENQELKEQLFPLIDSSSVHIDDETLKDLEHVVIPSVQEFSSFHQLNTTNNPNNELSETSATIYSAPNPFSHPSEEAQEHPCDHPRDACGTKQCPKRTRVEIVPFEYLIEEMRSRRAAMREMYKQWSEDAIKMALTSGTEPFQDLLTEVLESRKLVKQYQILDGTVCMLKHMDLYDLDVSGLHIELKTPRHYVTIKCNKYILSSSKFAKVYFESILKNLPSATNLALGVMYEEQLFHGCDSPAINGAFITTDGFIFERGQRRFSGLFLGSNDVVGAIVDMATETIRFYKNGQSVLEPLSLNPRSSKYLSYESNSTQGKQPSTATSGVEIDPFHLLGSRAKEPLDIITETTTAILDLSLAFNAGDILRKQQLQQSIDEKLMNRLDSIARSKHVYRIRPAIVSYCDLISQKSRPHIKMNFCKPYMYDKIANFSNTGYL